MFKQLVMLAVAVVFTAGSANAQGLDRNTPRAGADAQTGHPSILAGQRSSQFTSDQLIGAAVTNMAGEKIGTVDALLVSQDGRVDGVIVGLGGVMGLGTRSVGIAWDQTSMDSRGRLRLTGVSVAELEAAPEFERAKRESVPGTDAGPAPDRDGKPQRLLK